MTLKVCIIGCGDMGRTHAAGWQTYKDAEIVSLFDPMEERLSKLADATNAKPYSTYQEAILHEGVDVVSVCTPVCFHCEVSCFAARNGRHVLCEKPIALTLDQADEMIRTAEENGVLLSTSFQYRGFTRNQKYRELFMNGAFKEPVFIRFSDVREVRPKTAMHRTSMNGGPIIDMAGHYFDLMRYLTATEPVSVYAQGHIFGKGKDRLSGVDDLAVDAADIQVTMQGGHILNVFVNWGMPEGFAGYQEEALIGSALSARLVGKEIHVVSPEGKEIWEANAGNPPGSTVRIHDMAAAIREGRQPEVTGEDGRIALSVSLAALESIRTEKSISL